MCKIIVLSYCDATGHKPLVALEPGLYYTGMRTPFGLSKEMTLHITMNEFALTLQHDFSHFSSGNQYFRALALDRVKSYATAPPDEFAMLLDALATCEVESLEASPELFSAWMRQLVAARRKSRPEKSAPWLNAQIPTRVAQLFQQWPASLRGKYKLLEMLAVGATHVELKLFLQLIMQSPPTDQNELIEILSPLFQFHDYAPESLFPELLEALTLPDLAAPALDLANHLTRNKRLETHPALERSRELGALLGSLMERLQALEEHPERHAASPQALSKTIAHAVSLAVALCDALSLIGDSTAIPQLEKALSIRHRRIRTEAAAALARLGQSQGKQELLKLVSEPVARLRVLAYAEELGMAHEIEPDYATPASRAEAELTVWLTQPSQFGLPPMSCELLDERMQFWPGYEEAVPCFLFRYTYRFQTEQGVTNLNNIGIVGPLVKAFASDLTELCIPDIYACFAGWHVEHDDIYEVDFRLLSETQRIEAARLERRLRDAGYEEVQPILFSYFFGEKALISNTMQGKQRGVVLATMEDTLWQPAHAGERSLGPHDVLHLYRGRKLLREFNPDMTEE